jgi:UDP-3-O-[3-hydroxymyristoyl] glucosamine N-acyltransferase
MSAIADMTHTMQSLQFIEDLINLDASVKEANILGLREFKRHANGGGWIEKTASVEGSVYLGKNVIVTDGSVVKGSAKLYDMVRLYGCPKIMDCVRLTNNVRVFGNAKLSDYVCAYDDVHIHGYSVVVDRASIHGKSEIFENARVGGHAVLEGSCLIHGSADVMGGALIDAELTEGYWLGTVPANGRQKIIKLPNGSKLYGYKLQS